MIKRYVVIKVGSWVLFDESKRPCISTMKSIAKQVKWAQENGYLVVIVSSGAIRYAELTYPKRNFLAQTKAMVGQRLLLKGWGEVTEEFGLILAQALYVNTDLDEEKGPHTVEALCRAIEEDGVVGLVNENDALTKIEIRKMDSFGDNDQLASLLSILLKAEHLILLTTDEGVYSSRQGKELVSWIGPEDNDILHRLEIWQSDGEGGIESKIEAAQKAVKEGVKRATIASARQESVIIDVLSEKQVGTQVYYKTA